MRTGSLQLGAPRIEITPTLGRKVYEKDLSLGYLKPWGIPLNSGIE